MDEFAVDIKQLKMDADRIMLFQFMLIGHMVFQGEQGLSLART